jgi:L-fuconolactonase
VIVDAQIHVWETVRRGAVPHRSRPFLGEDAIAAMDAAGVDRAILVPPLWDVRGNGPAIRAAAAYPDRFAVMGRPWSRIPPRALAHATYPLVGYRLVAAFEPFRAQIVRGEADAFWRAAERRSAPVMVFGAGLMRELDRVAGRHPDLRLIVDNLGLPRDAHSEELGAHIDALLPLARRPNVAVKASALPCYSVGSYPFGDLLPIFTRVFEAFGHERVFWGSDLTRLPCSYSECVDQIRHALGLSEAEQAWVLGRGLAAWLPWPHG